MGCYLATSPRASIKIPRFRNILVYEYLAIDPNRVYEILQHGLSDLELFIEYVYDFLRREGYLEE